MLGLQEAISTIGFGGEEAKGEKLRSNIDLRSFLFKEKGSLL